MQQKIGNKKIPTSSYKKIFKVVAASTHQVKKPDEAIFFVRDIQIRHIVTRACVPLTSHSLTNHVGVAVGRGVVGVALIVGGHAGQGMKLLKVHNLGLWFLLGKRPEAFLS
jgi:hypothetical protein